MTPRSTLTAVFAAPLERHGDPSSGALHFYLVELDEARARQLLQFMNQLEPPSSTGDAQEEIRRDRDDVELVKAVGDSLPTGLVAALHRAARERHALEIAGEMLPDDEFRTPDLATLHVTQRAAHWTSLSGAETSSRTVPLPRWMLHRYLLRQAPAGEVSAHFMDLAERDPVVAARLLEHGLEADLGGRNHSTPFTDQLGEEVVVSLLSHPDRQIREHAIVAAGGFRSKEDVEPPSATR